MNGRPGEMPQRLRTSARSAGVTVACPWPRAYASTAWTTIARANAGIASSRARAAGSQASAKRTSSPNVCSTPSRISSPPWAPGW